MGSLKESSRRITWQHLDSLPQKKCLLELLDSNQIEEVHKGLDFLISDTVRSPHDLNLFRHQATANSGLEMLQHIDIIANLEL
jgi:hypothetical protein